MRDHPPTRRRIFVLAAACVAVVASFLAGRCWEHFRNGRWYQVHDSRTYESALGAFHLRHVTETTGQPFLDPGTSVISFQAPMGEIILYRSNRVFQEPSPWVDQLQLDGNDARWSDGEYRYSLRIERVAPTTQP